MRRFQALSKLLAFSGHKASVCSSASVMSGQPAAPAVGTAFESAGQVRPEQQFETEAEVVDWQSWWRKRLEQDVETAVRQARGAAAEVPGQPQDTEGLGRASGPARSEHLELARRALAECADLPAVSLEFPSGIPDSHLPVLTERMDGLQTSLDSLREHVRSAIESADRSGVIIDRLEAENRALKRHEAERKQEPLLKAVISLFDDLRSVARHAGSRAAAAGQTEPELLQSLLVFERQALEVLRRSYVDPFEPAIGEPLDAARQEAWETVEADRPDQDMRIAQVLRLGFEFDGRIIRPAAVKVYRFRAGNAQGS